MILIIIMIMMIPRNIVATAVTWKTMKSYCDVTVTVTSTMKNSLGGTRIS
jgi:hypothetical protein